MAKHGGFYFPVAITSSLLVSVVYGGCGNSEIGVFDVNRIPDSNISSSSASSASKPAKNGRLNYTEGSSWCASSRDSTPYLQVDLGSVHIICAVATQGNFQEDQWVKTYQIKHSTDGISWFVYQEQFRQKTFHGNYDRSTVVKRFLYEGIQARYIRVYPKTHHGGVCLRLELYGLTKQACSQSAIGVSEKETVPDYRFTASSFFDKRYAPYNARLRGSSAWGPNRLDLQNPSLNIDLGNAYLLCAVETQGHRFFREWITKYKLKVSMDNDKWQTYREGGGNEFNGNRDFDLVQKNLLDKSVGAKVIQLLPAAYNDWPSLRVEVYGTVQGCGSSLGTENAVIKNSQLTASSGTASDGRLYNAGAAWCANTGSNMEYLQVELGSTATIRGFATQGHPKLIQWTKTLAIKYSYDNQEWHEFHDDSPSWKIFATANNQRSMKASWFKHPFVARYVRIYPQTWEVKPCLRLDLYGCNHANFPEADAKTKDDTSVYEGHLNVNLECQGHGEPTPDVRWKNGSVDVTKRAQLVRKEDGLTVSRLPAPLIASSCSRQSLKNRTMTCTLPSYICQVSYPPSEGSAMVSSQSSTFVNLDLPDAVKDLRTNGSQGSSATLIWTAPDSGHAPITSYKIHYQVQGTRDYLNVASNVNASSFALSGLEPDTNYTVRVVAVSALGEGLRSVEALHFSTKHKKDAGRKAAPTNLDSTEGNEVTYIIGGVVASVAFVAVVLVVLFIIIRRRMKQTQASRTRQEQLNLQSRNSGQQTLTGDAVQERTRVDRQMLDEKKEVPSTVNPLESGARKDVQNSEEYENADLSGKQDCNAEHYQDLVGNLPNYEKLQFHKQNVQTERPVMADDVNSDYEPLSNTGIREEQLFDYEPVADFSVQRTCTSNDIPDYENVDKIPAREKKGKQYENIL